MNETKEVHSITGTLACRPKGANWVATLKVGHSTESLELEIGSINLDVIMENDTLKQEFTALMRKVINHIVIFNDPEAKVVYENKES